MRALFEITHPAHVHLFRHAVAELDDAGHPVAVTARVKDLTTDLLDAYGIDHVVLSRNRAGATALPREWVPRTARLLRYARRFDPDVIVSRRNPAAAAVAAALSVPYVMFHDTEAVGVVDWLTCPAATLVCTPATFERSVPGTQRRYDGYQELAYLHPDRFTPDRDAVAAAGVEPDAFYSVVRFVSNDAFHDVGRDGISPAVKRELVTRLADHGPVYVSSEAALPPDLDAHASPVPPGDMHNLLAFANLYVGDSGTMATEAALLGTPTVRFAPIDRPFGNFEELGDRGLMISSTDEREVVRAATDLADDPEAGERWERRREALLDEKIDVTGFVLDRMREVTA